MDDTQSETSETEQEPTVNSIATQTTRISLFEDYSETALPHRGRFGLSMLIWHQEMHRHNKTEESGTPKISLWDWLEKLCTPCKRLEGINYDAKICKCCCKYKTYKLWVTGFMIAAALYFVLLEFLDGKILPGRIYFVLLIMFVFSSIAGYTFTILGLPKSVAYLIVGITFGNLPLNDWTDYNDTEIHHLISLCERIMLVIMIIRAGLNLDCSKIKGHVRFILQYTFVLFLMEFSIVLVCTRYFINLPWEWSFLQAWLLVPVSLSSTLTMAEKVMNYMRADCIMPTLIIASAAIETVISLYGYSLSMGIIFAKGHIWGSSDWATVIAVLIQFLAGVLIGIILGCIAGMFPDRRSLSAPYTRITLIGLSTMALIGNFDSLSMPGVGVLSSITMIVIATNIWEELGWQSSNNPVLYIYNLVHIILQPIGMSMVGFAIQFSTMKTGETIGQTIGTIVLGLIGRLTGHVIMCFDKHLSLTLKEKILLAICMCPKGATEVLLAAVLEEQIKIQYNYKQLENPEEDICYTNRIFQATVFALLLTAPVVAILITFLSQKLLKGPDHTRNIIINDPA